MQIRKLAAVAALVLGLAACATVEQSTRVPAGFSAVEFNRVSSTYMARPTFAELNRYSDGREALVISMDRYSGSRSAVVFLRGEESTYREALDRFLSWEATARQRGDAFTRELARLPSAASGTSSEIRATFHSGSAATHYLELTPCVIGTCLDNMALHITPEGARKLSALLAEMAAGKLQQKDLGTVYR